MTIFILLYLMLSLYCFTNHKLFNAASKYYLECSEGLGYLNLSVMFLFVLWLVII